MIKFAVVGYGWWGQHIVRRLQAHEELDVRAVVEPRTSQHQTITDLGLTALTEIESVLSDPEIDAVVLTTPNEIHEKQVHQAAAAGKHVYCEKPLGLTADSARRSVDACEKARVQLGMGHERRFEPALQSVRQMVLNGDLGTIMHAEAAFSHDKLIHVPPGDWRTSPTLSPAAGMTAMGVHLTDYYISIFGRVKTVQAITARRLLEWETGDVVTAQLGFEAGMTATLSALLYTPHFIRTHVFGSHKWAEARSDTHPDTPGGVTELVVMQTGQEPSVTRFDWTDTVTENLLAFAQAVRGEADYPIKYDEMIHNIEVLEAIAESAQSGKTVHLKV
ncbi:MAG: Gfo/Idh/MocA family protein [Hyphomicrobiaceae bacterium]